MKESIGYTVTLNIVIMFIVIVFAFLSAVLIYYKSNKINNVIIDSIEKYEGFNNLAVNEINTKMSSLGYNINPINNCSDTTTDGNRECNIVNEENSRTKGYCVYECIDEDYYYYRVRSRMVINIPLVNELLNIPVFSNTNRLYDFSMINEE